MQTHPHDRNIPCTLWNQSAEIPENGQTALKLRVSHHPHGDWQLRVSVNGKVLADQIVGPNTVGPDEWMNLSVDLTEFAGQKIKLSLENKANDWRNEWAYWNRIEIVNESL